MVKVNKNPTRPLIWTSLAHGNEDEESPYFLANTKNRIYFNSRPGVLSCRIREKSTVNTAREFAWNARAFLDGNAAFISILNETAARIADEDYVLLLKVAGCPKELIEQRNSKDPAIHKRMFVYNDGIHELTKKEVMDALQLFLTHSCKLAGYEVELFYLKCILSGWHAYWIARVCYHAAYPAAVSIDIYHEALRFQDLVDKIQWLP